MRSFKITESKNWHLTPHGYQGAASHAAVTLPLPAVRVLNPRFREIEKTGHFFLVEEQKPGGAAFCFEVVPEPVAEPLPVAGATALSQLPDYVPGQRTMRYAGIGARQTPEAMLRRMSQVAARLEQLGYTLLSGGAVGADTAFAAGAGARKQVFLAHHARTSPLALALVEQVHPNPAALSTYPRELMARNAFQVFGAGLDAPVDFVLAWTPDAVQTHAQRTRQTGGTGQAISLASLKGVPVINLACVGWEQRIRKIVGEATIN